MIRKMFVFFIFLALLKLNAGTVTLINLSNFISPVSQTFGSRVDGNVSGTDAIFQNIGISSISASSSAAINDLYDSYYDGRALFYDGQLFFNSPGGGRKHYLGPTVFTFNLSGYYSKIAFKIPDYNTAMTATFYDNSTNVGSYTTANLNASGIDFVGFQNTSLFNKVVLTGSTDGYGISQITMEAQPVPELSSWILVALFAIVGYFFKR